MKNYRHLQMGTPFSDRDAFVRSSSKMGSFLETEMQIRNGVTKLEEEKQFLPEITHFMACVPEIESSDVSEPIGFTTIPFALQQSTLMKSSPQLQSLLSSELSTTDKSVEVGISHPEVSFELLRKTAAVLAAHAGFEG